VFEHRLDPKKLDELARGVMDKLPSGFQTLQDDMEKNLRAALQSALAKLELVTRDEFEVQSAVLQRTREKLEALETRVSELEKQQT
jgi:BMFP domain-containing protein YqiC